MKRKREKHCPKIKAAMSTAFTCHDWPIPLWDSRQEGLRQSSLSLNFNVHLHLKPPAHRPNGYHLGISPMRTKRS